MDGPLTRQLTRQPWLIGRDPDDPSKCAVFEVPEHGAARLVEGSGGQKDRRAAERWITYHATGARAGDAPAD